MHDVDFVEIGTSDFDTLTWNMGENAVGLAIEPLGFYLDKLPNRQRVKKIQCAVSLDNKEGEALVYYVPPHIIKQYNLPEWIRGCNRIGDYHKIHRELKIENLVCKDVVRVVPIGQLLQENDIQRIGHLKMDTEGGDGLIMNHLYEYLNDKPEEYWPKKITFETNELNDQLTIFQIIVRYLKRGYLVEIISLDSETTLVRI